MPGVREKGKIDQAEWDDIVARYESGESLASIARSYSCTPPAIRYIVSRKRKAADANRALHIATGPATAGAPDGGRDRAIRKAPSAGVRGSNGSAAKSVRHRRIGPPDQRHAEPGDATGFDRAVKDRVTSDISAFLIALDTLSQTDSPANRECLFDATDRLLRAGARARIELERLQQSGEDGGS